MQYWLIEAFDALVLVDFVSLEGLGEIVGILAVLTLYLHNTLKKN